MKLYSVINKHTQQLLIVTHKLTLAITAGATYNTLQNPLESEVKSYKKTLREKGELQLKNTIIRVWES